MSRPIMESTAERTPDMDTQPSSTRDAVRMRRWRTRSGRSSRTLVDLTALGTLLADLQAEGAHALVERIVAAVGQDVAARARIAAAAAASRAGGRPDLARDSAG